MSDSKSRQDEVEGVGQLLQKALDEWAESRQGADQVAVLVTTALLPDEVLAAMLRRVSFGVPDAAALVALREIAKTLQLSWQPPPGFTAQDWALVRRSSVADLMGRRDE